MPSWMQKQEAEIDRVVRDLSESDDGRERIQRTLNATISEALNHTRAALRQYERRDHPLSGDGDPGQSHAEMHTLLLLAHEAICTSGQATRLLTALGKESSFSPDAQMRERLREARNLLAEHRDERVLYWRLTGEHTENVVKRYAQMNVELPAGTIDVETFYSESEIGTRWGTVGNLLSLPALHGELTALEEQLDALLPEVESETDAAPQPGETVKLRLKVVGPITVSTS